MQPNVMEESARNETDSIEFEEEKKYAVIKPI